MEQKLYPEINRVVATESGLVQGVPGNTPQYTVFKGIPYAAPPVGCLLYTSISHAVNNGRGVGIHGRPHGESGFFINQGQRDLPGLSGNLTGFSRAFRGAGGF